MKYISTLFACLCFVAGYSQPSTLDKSFGRDGIVIAKTYNGECNDLLVQQDGKIVVIGRGTYNNLAGGVLLIRYNIDGTPDLSFGDSGRVATSPSPSGNYGAYGALQQDGKIIVAGEVGAKPALIRYNSNGTIDSTFGKNGIVVQPLTKIYENPTGLTIQADGKILLSGTDEANSEIENFWAIYIIRYNIDGSLDESFGNAGIYEEEVWPAITTAGIAVQPDGNILVGGNYPTLSGHPFFIRQYTKDGTPDKSFGINGEARYNFTGSNGSYIYSIALQADGKTIAAGSTFRTTFTGDATLIRFNADGSVDKNFGKNGASIIFLDDNTGLDIKKIVVRDNGTILAGARIYDGLPFSYSNFASIQYTNDGNIDSSYGENGIQITALNGSMVTNSLILQKDGKFILGGNLYDESTYPYQFVTLARYNGDKNKQFPVVRIKRWLQHHGISWQGVQGGNNIRYYTVQRSGDGIVYKDIAKVSSKVMAYEDNIALSNTGSYYRIAATGWDGSHTYSNTILIDDSQQARIFPNPVRDNLQLQGLPANGKTNLSVLDLNGNVRSTATASGTNYSVSTANLSAGSYLLKIQHNGTTVTQPFVKE